MNVHDILLDIDQSLPCGNKCSRLSLLQEECKKDKQVSTQARKAYHTNEHDIEMEYIMFIPLRKHLMGSEPSREEIGGSYHYNNHSRYVVRPSLPVSYPDIPPKAPTWITSLDGKRLPDSVISYIPKVSPSAEKYREIIPYDLPLPTVILSIITTYIDEVDAFRLVDGVSLPLKKEVQYDKELSSAIIASILSNDDIVHDYIWAARRAGDRILGNCEKICGDSEISRIQSFMLCSMLEGKRKRGIDSRDITSLVRGDHKGTLQRISLEDEGGLDERIPLRPLIIHLIKDGKFRLLSILCGERHWDEQSLLTVVARENVLYIMRDAYLGCDRKLEVDVPMGRTLLSLIKNDNFDIAKRTIHDMRDFRTHPHNKHIMSNIIDDALPETLEIYLCEVKTHMNEEEIEESTSRAAARGCLEKVYILVEAFLEALLLNRRTRGRLLKCVEGVDRIRMTALFKSMSRYHPRRRRHLKEAGRRLYVPKDLPSH